MTESLAHRLLRLTSGGPPVILTGRDLLGHLGRGLDRLLDRRVLVEQARTDEWGPCSGCDLDCGSRPVQEIDGRLIAACPHDAACDEILSHDDVRQFQLELDELVLALREDNNLGGDGPAAVSDGVWLVGASGDVGAVPRSVFMAIGSILESPANVLAVMRRFSQPGAAAIITTGDVAVDARVVFEDAGMAIISPRSALIDDPSRMFRIDLTVRPLAASAPRMVLGQADGSVMIDNRTVILTAQSFQLLLLLAKAALAGPGFIGIRRIEDALWGNARTTRTVADAIRELRDALAPLVGDKPKAAKLIANRKGQGYRLALKPQELAIRV